MVISLHPCACEDLMICDTVHTEGHCLIRSKRDLVLKTFREAGVVIVRLDNLRSLAYSSSEIRVYSKVPRHMKQA